MRYPRSASGRYIYQATSRPFFNENEIATAIRTAMILVTDIVRRWGVAVGTQRPEAPCREVIGRPIKVMRIAIRPRERSADPPMQPPALQGHIRRIAEGQTASR